MEDTSRGTGRAIVGDTNWKDYALEFRVKVFKPQSNGDFGFQANVRVLWDSPIHPMYQVFMGSGGRGGIGYLSDNPGVHDLSSGINFYQDGVGGPIQANRWYGVRIEIVGTKLRVYLDGHVAAQAIDDSPLIANGNIALGAESFDQITYFDDVRITEVVPYTSESPSTPTP